MFVYNVLKMAEAESMLESERFLWELSTHPSSVHKAPNNRYQHFVNAYVLTNQTMKRADAVRCVQAVWKQWVVDNKEQYVKEMRKAAEYLKCNGIRWIDSFLKIQFINQ